MSRIIKTALIYAVNNKLTNDLKKNINNPYGTTIHHPIRKDRNMKNHILFTGTGRETELTGTIHFNNIKNWSDYTLCGITLDNDSSTAGESTLTEKPVNCKRCIEIVRYCKSLKISEITKGKTRD